ncbi:hypothetical protein O4214_25170 [Rhodococcus erythropolis]|uniref:hypothetical protein n=1 Tax=Rhodococcus erythropolis TaxID=1833 RepID=UPI001E4868C7|nr:MULTISPECIES: hypothetical protein [Rhodococcus erythropolis group]MCD2108135.1 hypothetical protein [Rhodococcus qingshengii]MCZ4527284.1 hypothetical protein [Rhodococcus erythropolis]
MPRLTRLLDNEVVQRWAGTIATILFPLIVLPSAVNRAVEDASAWNWAILMILVGGLIAVATDAITKWRKHFARKKQA